MLFHFTQISDQQLLDFNKQGWIPGPNETEEAFLKRIEILNHFFSYPPSDLEDFLTDNEWKGARELTKQLFDFSVDWVVGFYSNRSLSPFQGAATWLVEQNRICIPLIQLKKTLKHKKLLQLYSLQEVLSHESVHATRLMFTKSKFEEIFAYMTSSSKFRKCFGALFESSWQVNFFLGLILLPLLFQIFYICFDLNFLWLYLISIPAIGWLLFFLIRLFYLKFKLKKCFLNLKNILQDNFKSRAVIFRLTDEEIFEFSRRSKEEILDQVNKQSKKNLKFRLLKLAYF